MKKNGKKLGLCRETLRKLETGELRNAAGGETSAGPSLFAGPNPCGPMKDTGDEEN